MDPGILALIAITAGLSVLLLNRFWQPGGMFTSGRTKIPKKLIVEAIDPDNIPTPALQPMEVLGEKLERVGFERAAAPVRVPAVAGFGHELVLVLYAHTDESSIFLMGIDARFGSPELMLHILSPLTDGRRVETSTLTALRMIRAPEPVDLNVVEDADSIEEIWSRHRRAIRRYERKELLEVSPDDWKRVVSGAYESWVAAAVRAQRLALTRDPDTYRLRLPS